MSRRLDLPIALAAWLLGFAWTVRTGSWTFLALVQIATAARLVVGDAATRNLLTVKPMPLALGVGGAVATTAATYLAFAPLARAVPSFAPATKRLYDLFKTQRFGPIPLAILLLVVILSEEIVWRGRLLDPAKSVRGSRAPAWRVGQTLACVAAYGLAHVTSGSVLLIVVALLCGGVWAFLRMTTGSLWTSFVAHAIWDLAVLLVWPLRP